MPAFAALIHATGSNAGSAPERVTSFSVLLNGFTSFEFELLISQGSTLSSTATTWWTSTSVPGVPGTAYTFTQGPLLVHIQSVQMQ